MRVRLARAPANLVRAVPARGGHFFRARLSVQAMTDDHHDQRYEDGEPYLPLVAVNAYREWFDTLPPDSEREPPRAFNAAPIA